jgi:hypothetical protein
MQQKQYESFEQLEGINIKFYFNTAICLNMSSNAQANSAAFTLLTKRQFLSVIENMRFSSTTNWITVYYVHLNSANMNTINSIELMPPHLKNTML